MPADPFKDMNLSRREYLSKFGQSVIDSPGANISDKEDALIVQEGLANQRGREAQQQFYNVAPNAREAFLEDNAVISASPQFGQVQGYMGEVRRGPTYADRVLRNSIASKVPAYLRSEFNARVDEGENVNDVYADLEIKDEDRNLRFKGIEAGIAPEELDKFRDPETGLHDPEKVQFAIAQRGRTSTSRSAPLEAMEANYKMLRQAVEDMVAANAGLAIDPEDNPEYGKAVAQMRALGKQIFDARTSVYAPAVPAAPAGVMPPGTAPASVGGAAVPAPAASAPAVAVDDPRSLREKLAGDATVFPAPEVKPPLVPGVTAPQEYLARIKSKGISQAERVAAYEQFKNDVEKGNLRPPPNATIGEALAARKDRERMLEEARVEVDLAPVRQQYEAAWSEAKSTLEKEIEGFARELGVEKEQVLNSLKTGERVTVEEPAEGEWGMRGRKEPVANLLAEYLKPKFGSIFEEVPVLKPFAESKFADRLGMGFFSFGAKKWSDVLDSYVEGLGAKGPAAAPAAAPASSVGTENLPRPRTPAEAKALPKGTKFLRPDGQIGYVP